MTKLPNLVIFLNISPYAFYSRVPSAQINRNASRWPRHLNSPKTSLKTQDIYNHTILSNHIKIAPKPYHKTQTIQYISRCHHSVIDSSKYIKCRHTGFDLSVTHILPIIIAQNNNSKLQLYIRTLSVYIFIYSSIFGIVIVVIVRAKRSQNDLS